MINYSFSKWINEYADFGLDMTNKQKPHDPDDTDTPLHPINVEYVVNFLKRKTLGEKYAMQNDFFGEVHWGELDGALQLEFSTLGGMRAILRKLIHDLQGDPTWLCKKVIEVKSNFDAHPDKLIWEIQENLERIDREGLDSPSNDYEDLQRLVLNIASELRRKTTQKIFLYEGIRVVKENEKYIIHFGVTGMGVQARGQKRVDQFAIQVEYSKKNGLIKIAANDIGDDIDKHRWYYSSAEFIEYFSPFQKEEEIIAAILTNFNCY